MPAEDVPQVSHDIAELWGCDGRYLDQLSHMQRCAFDRLRRRGLALLEHRSKLDEQRDFGKVRVNDEVNVNVVYDPVIRTLATPPTP